VSIPVEPRAGSCSLYLLHGIFGRGRNWASIARQVVAARGDWQAVLADLRGHGDSALPPPPHTIIGAAKDVARLSVALGRRVEAVLGHSFGGKVALQFAAVAPEGLRQVWVIDSTPAPKAPDGSAWRMLQAIRANPGPYASRQEAAGWLVQSGFAAPVASWMASNVVWQEERYQWRLDFEVMEALLLDFFRVDLWSVIEAPPPGLVVHLVKATASTLLDERACARIEDASRTHGRAQLHRVQGGHWLNTDNPDALVRLLTRELPRTMAGARRSTPSDHA
jgi:pimeloyl-ACP methyl ester carboxylesterase